MSWFNPLTYANLAKAWHDQWAFMLDQPASSSAAPLWIGEFGTCNDDSGCFTQRARQGIWLGLVLRFLREHPQVGWSFFALNGTNANNCATDNGLVNAAWNNVASKGLARQLATALPEPPPASVLRTSGPLIPGAVPHSLPRSPSSPLCQLP
jgi:endoglucanase